MYVTTNGFETLVSIITLAVFIWAIIWSHYAFKRYEDRDNAKVKALQQIASSLKATKTASDQSELPEWAATR